MPRRPAIRQPPFRKDAYLKLLKSPGAPAGRGPPGAGRLLHLRRPFSGMAKCWKVYLIYKDNDSVIRRFAKVQGTGVFQLDEKMLIVSKSLVPSPSEEV